MGKKINLKSSKVKLPNKSTFIKNDIQILLTNKLGCSLKDSSVIIDCFIESITDCLKKGNSVKLINLGTFTKNIKEDDDQKSTRINFKVSKNFKDNL